MYAYQGYHFANSWLKHYYTVNYTECSVKQLLGQTHEDDLLLLNSYNYWQLCF